MPGDEILFILNPLVVEAVRRIKDLQEFPEYAVAEIGIGDFVILEGQPQHRYLLIKDPEHSFVGRLSHALAEAKRIGTQHLTPPMDQGYDIEIRCRANRCFLCDVVENREFVLELDLKAFTKSVERCAADVRRTMLTLFPELESRLGPDPMRDQLGQGKMRRPKK